MPSTSLPLGIRQILLVGKRDRDWGWVGEAYRQKALAAGKPLSDTEARELAAAHLGEVKAKIADLRAMERVLADTVRRCDAGEAPGCPLIETS